MLLTCKIQEKKRRQQNKLETVTTNILNLSTSNCDYFSFLLVKITQLTQKDDQEQISLKDEKVKRKS